MRSKLKYIVLIALLLFMVLGTKSCIDYLSHDDALNTYSTSPSGEVTLELEYDHLSRPSVYHNDNRIFEYGGSAFMETVIFEIEWISENDIRLFCEQHDEEFFITLE